MALPGNGIRAGDRPAARRLLPRGGVPADRPGRARTSSRATSSRGTPSTTPSRWTWRWAAPPTRPPHAGGGARGGGAVRPGAHRRDLADRRPPVQGVAVVASTTWRTWTAPAGSGDPPRAVARGGSHEPGLPHRHGEDPGGEHGEARRRRTRRSSGPLAERRTARRAGSRSCSATSPPRARWSRPPASTRRCWIFEGPAVIFDSQDDACDGNPRREGEGRRRRRHPVRGAEGRPRDAGDARADRRTSWARGSATRWR